MPGGIHEMNSFNCIYELLPIQLKQIGSQYKILSASGLCGYFFIYIHTVSWLGNEELVTAYILCNIILWCNKLK